MLMTVAGCDQAGRMSVISLHRGGSPEAMRREICRSCPIEDRRALALRLLDRGLLDTGQPPLKQPGRCCPVGCQLPETPVLGGAERGKLAAE
jgi:4-hydroxybutyryl-CoA dehydratase/vinylacetyl-CoA-Delta-isomerase